MSINELVVNRPAQKDSQVWNDIVYREWKKLGETNKIIEIIEGELIMPPAPTTTHQKTVIRLSAIIYNFVSENKLGEVFAAPTDVFISKTRILQPDILFIHKDRLHIIEEENIKGAPDLVVEVLSPTSIRRDRLDKAGIYAEIGVKEYWLVDPYRCILAVYILKEKKFELFGSFEHPAEVKSAVLPEFSFSTTKIWD